MIDFDKFNRFLLSQFRSFAQQWAPGGNFEGHEYKPVNPTRSDKQPGSFSININTGKWSDYADTDPDATGTTPLSLYHYLNRDRFPKFKDAVESLAAEVHFNHETPIPKEKKKYTKTDVFRQIHPVPDNALPYPKVFKRTESGVDVEYPIEQYYEYVNTSNKIIGYVTRYTSKYGKETPPLCYCQNKFSNEYQWVFIEFGYLHPIYNMYRIAQNPEATIIIVEGEKCAKALQVFFDQHNIKMIVTCWIGGCKAKIDKINWKILEKRTVILWPDNDTKKYPLKDPNAGKIMMKHEQPGHIVMKKIESVLVKMNCTVLFMDPVYTEKPDGWDCYDAIHNDNFSIDQVQEFIKSRSLNTPSKPTIPETPADQSPPFKSLGFDKDTFFYLPAGTGQVKGIRGGGHSPGELICLAGKEYWFNIAPGQKGNPDWIKCADIMMRTGEKIGIYDPSQRRGRGAWIDQGRIVLHLGSRLIVDEKELKVEQIDSKYIYERGIAIDVEKVDPLSNDEAYEFLKVCHMFDFSGSIDAFLLAGYSVLVPICGALDFRPNIWLTGPSQSGKSYVLRKVLHPAVGPFSVFVSSGASAAAIRYKLITDAFGVLYDEAEGETEKTQQLIYQVFEIARGSSTQSGAKTLKATQNQKVNEYETRAMFSFASIGVSATQSADVSRLAVLQLEKHKGDSMDIQKRMETTEEYIDSVMTPEFCARLRARTFKLIPIIRKNAKTLTKVIAEQYGLKRFGDLYGTLLAGAITLKLDVEITYEEAVDWLKDFDLEGYKESFEASADEQSLLNVILQHTIAIDSSSNKLSIAELVTSLTKYVSLTDANYGEDQLKRIEILKRYGIRVDMGNKLRKHIMWISNSHNAIKLILEDTPWPRTWGKILQRIDGALKKNMRFTGHPEMATGIPFDKFYNVDDREVD